MIVYFFSGVLLLVVTLWSLPHCFFDCVPARCRCTCWRSPSGRSCLLPQSTPWWIQPGSEGRNCPSDRPLQTPFGHSHLLLETQIKVRSVFLCANRKPQHHSEFEDLVKILPVWKSFRNRRKLRETLMMADLSRWVDTRRASGRVWASS